LLWNCKKIISNSVPVIIGFGIILPIYSEEKNIFLTPGKGVMSNLPHSFKMEPSLSDFDNLLPEKISDKIRRLIVMGVSSMLVRWNLNQVLRE
jgi:hypothetical protein